MKGIWPRIRLGMMFRQPRAVRLIARQMCSSAETVTVSIAEARSKTAAAMRAIGWDEEDAALQAEIMTAAELCGNNRESAWFDPSTSRVLMFRRPYSSLSNPPLTQRSCDRHPPPQRAW